MYFCSVFVTLFFFYLCNCSVIGEEGEADLMKIKSDFLTSNQDETVFNHYQDRLPSHIQDAKIEDLTVWVDPLDGTKEYTEGYLDHVTVLVGIAIGKKAIGGVIHQPFWNYQGGSQLLYKWRFFTIRLQFITLQKYEVYA